MIDSSDISVIVQGGINNYTSNCLIKIRKLLPESQIVLATQKENNFKNLIYDDIVLIDDPGSTIQDYKMNTYNNVNRQILTTQAGLKKADRRYILKFRTDLYLETTNFLNYFNVYDIKKNEYTIFKNKILICNYYTRNPRVVPLPFHPSDWIMFGNKEDIIKYYCDIELQTKEDANWFMKNVKNSKLYFNSLCRFFPEQHICLEFLRKHYPVNCNNYYDNSIDNIILTEKFLANNTVIIDYDNISGIIFPKYNPNRYKDKMTLIKHSDWLIMYNKYTNNKKSIKWYGYLVKTFFLKVCYMHIYIFLSRLLDFLHIKKFIKSIFNYKKFI
ncbi:MAG: hypothetical protein K0R05_3026 [Anaerocolumna sp.]|jgi:hypothetical protein|nr:hypothetical protein [Anaerocolumna sp.]